MGMHYSLYPMTASDVAALADARSLEMWERARALRRPREMYMGSSWDLLLTLFKKLDPELRLAIMGREPRVDQGIDDIGYRYVDAGDVLELAGRLQAISLERIIEVYDPRGMTCAYHGDPSRHTFNVALHAWTFLVRSYQSLARSGDAGLIYIG